MPLDDNRRDLLHNKISTRQEKLKKQLDEMSRNRSELLGRKQQLIFINSLIAKPTTNLYVRLAEGVSGEPDTITGVMEVTSGHYGRSPTDVRAPCTHPNTCSNGLIVAMREELRRRTLEVYKDVTTKYRDLIEQSHDELLCEVAGAKYAPPKDERTPRGVKIREGAKKNE